MLRIIVDGSADMPEGWPEKYQFNILPIPIQIGEKTYYQDEDINPELFYELIKDETNIPRTAAPAPDRIQAFIENVCHAGDTVLSLNVSGMMSSTVSMVQHAALTLKDKMNLVVFDSKAGSAALALMAREARLRERAGESLDEILAALDAIREKLMIVLTINNLDFAYRSGRVGYLKAALSSLLNIKPIITLNKGQLQMNEMVRTRSKSLERIVTKIKEQFDDSPIRVVIVHAQDFESAKKLKNMFTKSMNIVETIFTDLSISVAANLGPKTIGVVALPENL
ncbi:MAG: DegV family protein [Brevefilum sp.]|jgi:DegV family protein with EDD domain